MGKTFKTSLLLFILLLATHNPVLASLTWQWSPGSRENWSCLASSADGMRLAAGTMQGAIYLSSNGGKDWTLSNSITNGWLSIASSADGMILAAVNANRPSGTSTTLHISTDAGATWIAGPPATVATCSSDGRRLAVVDRFGGVQVSENAGDSWTRAGTLPMQPYAGLASSADGTRLFATASRTLYRSLDAGFTWTTNVIPFDAPLTLSSIACSADGAVLLAAGGRKNGNTGPLLISSNLGETWSSADVPLMHWMAVTCSADGRRMFAAVAASGAHEHNPIYRSEDAGQTWTSLEGNPNAWWSSIRSSADGARLAAVGTQTNVFTWNSPRSPELNISNKGDGAVVSWLISSTPVVLEVSSETDSSESWDPLAPPAALNSTNLHNEMHLPLTQPHQFFRLMRVE
jgi:hypothetical protein